MASTGPIYPHDLHQLGSNEVGLLNRLTYLPVFILFQTFSWSFREPEKIASSYLIIFPFTADEESEGVVIFSITS